MSANIGKSIHIKGTITAEEPLVVAGTVEGSITVTGHSLTITPDGHVDVDAVADTITIDGTAMGRFQAEGRVSLRETATVVGDIIAKALAVADGATLQGHINTSSKESGSPRAGDLAMSVA
jgi:cytoskeletal protein CcmA (bactofilin family)